MFSGRAGGAAAAGPPQNVGPLELIETLAEEFRFNQEFGEKVATVKAKGYKTWRRVRGDGNCFWRSFGFGLLEAIIKAKPALRQRWAAVLRDILAALHLPDRALQAAHQRLVDKIQRLAIGQGWTAGQPGQNELQDLLTSFQDCSADSMDFALIRALRMTTAEYLMQHADEPELCNGLSFRVVLTARSSSPQAFCDRVILPMGVEAEGEVMNAIVPAFDVAMRIVYLDRSKGNNLNYQDYMRDDGVSRPLLCIQIRPGHYDLIHWDPEFVPEACLAAAASLPPAPTAPSQPAVVAVVWCPECGHACHAIANLPVLFDCQNCQKCFCQLCSEERLQTPWLVGTATRAVSGVLQKEYSPCKHVAQAARNLSVQWDAKVQELQRGMDEQTRITAELYLEESDKSDHQMQILGRLEQELRELRQQKEAAELKAEALQRALDLRNRDIAVNSGYVAQLQGDVNAQRLQQQELDRRGRWRKRDLLLAILTFGLYPVRRWRRRRHVRNADSPV